MSEHDAAELDDGALIRADVCIVGGGAAGIALALALGEAGIDVALLEGGSHAFEGPIQQLYDGDVFGLDYFPLDATRLRFFGGSTNHWEGYCRPLDPGDFDNRPSTELAAWPFTADELAPYYRRSNELCDLGPVDYDPQTWARRVGAPALPLSGATIESGVLRRSPPVQFGPRYREALANHEDVAVYLHANVTEIIVEGGRATGVRISQLDGRAQRVEASRVVLAVGGIENPRLLLASRDDRGRVLGNANDQVGRSFMEHPHVAAGHLLAAPGVDLRLYTGDLEVGDDTAVRGVFTVPRDVREAHGIRNLAATLYPATAADQREVQATPGLRGVRELGRSLMDTGAPTEVYRLALIAEQLPNARSRVTLSAHHRDALGMPRAELHWHLQPRDRETLRVGTELVAAGLAELGVGRVRTELHDGRDDHPVYGGHHHMGTTRMSEDPAHGVVDADAKVHGVDGLYVAGASIFPTGGWANPTLTLLATTLRLADHLVETG